MAILEQRISNNSITYGTSSNYRWYYKKITSKNYNANILGIPQLPKTLPVSVNDIKYKVLKSEEGRLDVIARKFYGAEYQDLMWVIMIYNNINDPFKQLEVGTELYIPLKSTIDGVLI